MTGDLSLPPADLIERVFELLAEADRITDKEVREASRHFSTAPSGRYVGGMSRGGQRVKVLALQRRAIVERLVAEHGTKFPDNGTEALVDRCMADSDLLDALADFELITRFGNGEAQTFEIGRGFELYSRPNDEEEDGAEEFPGLDSLPPAWQKQ